MSLNIKILFPLDHPPVTLNVDEPLELSASASELDTSKENLEKGQLLEKEGELFNKEKASSEKKKLNIIT